MAKTLWFCGRFYDYDESRPAGQKARWGLCGVFDSKDAAIAACETEADFIAPCLLNHNYSADTGFLVGQEYPLNPRGSEPA